MTHDLPPGWSIERQGDAWRPIPPPGIPDADLISDDQSEAEATVSAWIWQSRQGELPPPPLPPAALAALCGRLAEILREDWHLPQRRVGDGQRAAARLLRVDDRTVRRWLAAAPGEPSVPWAAAELLSRQIRDIEAGVDAAAALVDRAIGDDGRRRKI